MDTASRQPLELELSIADEFAMVAYLCWANRVAEASGMELDERVAVGLCPPAKYIGQKCWACNITEPDGPCYDQCYWACECRFYKKTRRYPRFVRRWLYRRRALEYLADLEDAPAKP